MGLLLGLVLDVLIVCGGVALYKTAPFMRHNRRRKTHN